MTKGHYGNQHIRYDGSCLIVPSSSIDFMHSVIDVEGKGLQCIIIESPDSNSELFTKRVNQKQDGNRMLGYFKGGARYSY